MLQSPERKLWKFCVFAANAVSVYWYSFFVCFYLQYLPDLKQSLWVICFIHAFCTPRTKDLKLLNRRGCTLITAAPAQQSREAQGPSINPPSSMTTQLCDGDEGSTHPSKTKGKATIGRLARLRFPHTKRKLKSTVFNHPCACVTLFLQKLKRCVQV